MAKQFAQNQMARKQRTKICTRVPVTSEPTYLATHYCAVQNNQQLFFLTDGRLVGSFLNQLGRGGGE